MKTLLFVSFVLGLTSAQWAFSQRYNGDSFPEPSDEIPDFDSEPEVRKRESHRESLRVNSWQEAQGGNGNVVRGNGNSVRGNGNNVATNGAYIVGDGGNY